MAEPIPLNTQLVLRERNPEPDAPPPPWNPGFRPLRPARAFHVHPFPRPHGAERVQFAGFPIKAAAFVGLALLAVITVALLHRGITAPVDDGPPPHQASRTYHRMPRTRLIMQPPEPFWKLPNKSDALIAQYDLVKALQHQESFNSRMETVFFDTAFGNETWTPRLEREYGLRQPILRRGLADCYVTGRTRDLRSVVSILQKFQLTQTITDIAADALQSEFVAFDTRPLNDAYTYLVLDLRTPGDVTACAAPGCPTWYAFGYSGGSVELIARRPMPQTANEWRLALQSIRDRGLTRVSVVASDPHPEVVALVQAVFPGSLWMPCGYRLVVRPQKFMPMGSDIACISEYRNIVANTDGRSASVRYAEWQAKWRSQYHELCGWLLSQRPDR